MANISRVLQRVVALSLRPLRFYGDTVRVAMNGSFPPGAIVLVGFLFPLAVVLGKILDILTASIQGAWHVVAVALLTVVALYLLAWLIYLICRNG